MFLILIIALPLLLILYLQIKSTIIEQRVKKHTTGPSALPLIGNAHQMGKTPSEILNNTFALFYKHGQQNFRFWIGSYLNIVIVNTKDLEFILSSNSLLEKSDTYSILHPWMGEGLLASHGSKWSKHRKMITPSFHFKILQEYHEVMNVNSAKFIKKLRDVSMGETIFDFQDQVHYFTLDVICDAAMGVTVNAMDNHDSDLVKAVHYLCLNLNMRAFHPLKRNNFLYKFFPEYQTYKKHIKIFRDFVFEVIEKRMESRKLEEAQKSHSKASDEFTKRKLAFLDTLLSATVDGRPLTSYEIFEEVATFMFAGHDTTTSAIVFCIYLLSRHSDVQKKVFEEQCLVMEQRNSESDASFQELTEMKYLDLVLKEVLRLYPSVPVVARNTDKDYEINGKFIPKGTSLNLFLMALGYQESVFPEPYRFDPERFNLATSNGKSSPFEYLPFSAGPRNCIGQKFAQLEIKTIVSKIVRTFDILPALDELASKDGRVATFFGPYKANQLAAHKYDPILSTVITLKSENGVHIRMKQRN